VQIDVFIRALALLIAGCVLGTNYKFDHSDQPAHIVVMDSRLDLDKKAVVARGNSGTSNIAQTVDASEASARR
jgi:hypothetical protein